MIDHTGIGVADVGRSAAFYEAALGALGMRRAMQWPESAGTDAVGYGLDVMFRGGDRWPTLSCDKRRGLLGWAEPILTRGGRAMGDYSEAFVAFDVAKKKGECSQE
jgi:catechol 2,3-dioxygenase-like lactoylglutathione lyase family enzyme